MEHPMYELRLFDGKGPFLDGVAAVYAQALHLNWEKEAVGFLYYARTFPDFHGLVALVEGKVVGVGWGTCTLPGEWLYDRVAAQIGSDHPALQDAWLLNILAVLEAYQGQGIGSGLHDALIEAQPCSRALVCTHVENATARRFYEHKGWRYFQPGCLIQAGERQIVVLYKERC